MALLYEEKQGEIVITGYEGEVSYLQIPAELRGLPVRKIGRSAFARRRELLAVYLPESLHVLGRFAFYACSGLEKVHFGNGSTEMEDGVFRQCGNLREAEMDLTGGDYTALKELLSENDRKLRVKLRLPGGEACLNFPDYVVDFDEDTFARVLHTRIEGAGFAYRESITKKGIDFRGYDRAFGRIRGTEPALAAQIALDRLCSPLGMEETAGRDYEEYLRDHCMDALRLAVEQRQEDWLRLLLERKLMTQEAFEEGLRLASGAGETAMVSLLMKERPKKTDGRLEL